VRSRPSFLVAATALALASAVTFLALRGGDAGVGVAAYAVPDPSPGDTAWVLVETFDLAHHGTVPAAVVAVEAPGEPRPLAFAASGGNPVLVRIGPVPGGVPDAIGIVTRGTAGEGRVTVPIRGAPAPAAGGGDRAWPIRGACGDRDVILVAGPAAAEGVPADLLVLVSPRGTAADTVVEVRSSGGSAQAPLAAWGGAVVPVSLKALRTTATVLLRDAGTVRCQAEVVLPAAPRRPAAQVAVEPAPGGSWRIRATVATRDEDRPVFALVARRGADGPGPLVAADVARVVGGTAGFLLDLPGPGVFQVRLTSRPLDASAPAVDAIVSAGREAPLPAWIDLGRAADDARERALPFLLAADAEATPVALVQVANSSADERERRASGRSRRNGVLLGLLGAALAAQVVWGVVLVLRGYLRRETFADDADVVPVGPPGRDLLSALLLAFVLLATIAAVVWLLAGL
jgi:hypothetical protein